MLSIEYVTDPSLKINVFEDWVSVFWHSSSEDDDLVELAHLKKENI